MALDVDAARGFLGTDISVCNVMHRDGFNTAHARNRRDSYSAYPAHALI
jgi:hypothetical protein